MYDYTQITTILTKQQQNEILGFKGPVPLSALSRPCFSPKKKFGVEMIFSRCFFVNQKMPVAMPGENFS